MNNTGRDIQIPKIYAKNQDGFILVLTLIMLTVLSILGVMALNSTNTELAITSNYRLNNDAFIASLLGVEYSKELIVNDYADLPEGDNQLDQPINSKKLDDLISGLGLPGISLTSSSGNVINHFLDAPTTRRSSSQSADNTTNVYTTTESGGSQDVPYYRISVDITARGRGSSKIDAVVERIADTSL